MSYLQAYLDAQKEQDKRIHSGGDFDERHYEHYHNIMDRCVHEMMSEGGFKRASIGDYTAFLAGYANKHCVTYSELKEKIHHHYDYPFGRWNWYVPSRNFTLLPMYGAMSIEIIVPKDIKVYVPNGYGHNSVFYMDNFNRVGTLAWFEDIPRFDVPPFTPIEILARRFKNMEV